MVCCYFTDDDCVLLDYINVIYMRCYCVMFLKHVPRALCSICFKFFKHEIFNFNCCVAMFVYFRSSVWFLVCYWYGKADCALYHSLKRGLALCELKLNTADIILRREEFEKKTTNIFCCLANWKSTVRIYQFLDVILTPLENRILFWCSIKKPILKCAFL